MAKRDAGDARRVREISPRNLYERLAGAFGITDIPKGALDVVRAPFPDVNLSDFRERYLLREVLRKYPGFDLGVDRSAEALKGLIAQEALNRESNRRIPAREYGDNPYVRQAYCLARDKISEILGPFDPDKLVKFARFGPKATTKASGGNLGLEVKLSKRPHVTREALPLAQWYIKQAPMWASAISESGRFTSEPTPVWTLRQQDRVTCIPKNAEIDRTVTPQPCFCSLLQLGVGGMLRERLFARGVNLNDQSINQLRARNGSRWGRIATVDLRNASNSICSALIYDLIGNVEHSRSHSWEWYTVMESLRTTSGWIGKVEHEWELFSSMGNGFTFELETLVFYALTCATCAVLDLPEDVTTYGDDITCPVEAVPLLTEVFAFCGFTLNTRKSFWSTEGPLFRESCGMHYLDGRDVTPFYVDTLLDSDVSIILLANNLVRWSHVPGGGRDGRVKGVWEWIVRHLSDRARKTRIPMGEANDGLILDFDEACPSVAYTCAGDSEVVQARANAGDGYSFVNRAEVLSRMRLGYRAVTVSAGNRPTSVGDPEGHLCWHYLKDCHRFTLPSAPVTVPTLRGLYPSLLAGSMVDDSSPYEPYRKPGLKESVKWGTRVVTSWPYIGPWVTPGENECGPAVPSCEPAILAGTEP